MKFFLNSNNDAYLRGLEEEFQESTNAIRVELNRLEQAKMLVSRTKGNKKLYSANKLHPLFNDVKSLVLKHVGIDTVIENVIRSLGNLERAYLTGSLAMGLDADTIMIVLIGNINEQYLQAMIEKYSPVIKRKIAYELLPAGSHFDAEANGAMLLWESM